MSHNSQNSFSILTDLFDPDVQQEINRGLGSQDLQPFYDLDYPGPPIWETVVEAPVQEDLAVDEKVVVDHISIDPRLIPTPASEIMSTEDHEGSLLFGVKVLSNDKSKNPWVYSPKLNKVFMEMNKSVPVDFNVENPARKTLFIRATLQYSAQEFAAEPVMRCIQHDFVDDESNKDILDHVRPHVVRCSNNLAYYIGNCKAGERPSILFPLSIPQTGSHSVRELFQFVCKSSCALPGMNRREVDMIFTLEDEKRTVIGRKSLKVKVCACPKRDKEKEEKELEKGCLPWRPGKRRKLGHSSSCEPAKAPSAEEPLVEYSLKIRCFGKKSVQKVLQYVEDVNLAQLYELRDEPLEQEKVKQNLHDILNVKQKFNS